MSEGQFHLLSLSPDLWAEPFAGRIAPAPTSSGFILDGLLEDGDVFERAQEQDNLVILIPDWCNLHIEPYWCPWHIGKDRKETVPLHTQACNSGSHH